MKKILFSLVAIALFAAASCTVDEMVQDNETIIASIEAVSTRTALADAGDHYDVNWVAGDQITVDNGTKTAIYQTTTGGSTTGEFHKITWGAFTGDSFTGYYPSEIANGYLPFTQTYAAGNVFKVPMVSDPAVDLTNLRFKPVTGILKLSITTGIKTLKIKSIRVSADQGLSGSFTLVDGAAIVADDRAGVLLDCGDGVEIGGTATPFYIAVPANLYTGIRITLYNTEGRACVVKLQDNTSYSVRNAELREIKIAANSFSAPDNGGEALLCYGTAFNEALKQLVVPRKRSHVEDSVVTKIVFKTNDYTAGTVKVSNFDSEFPIYASLEGTVVTVTTPASSIRTAENACHMFAGFTLVEEIENINVLNTSATQDFSYMFSHCTKLKSVDLSRFETSASMTFAYMFSYCQSLKVIDVSKFDTSNALSLGFMFYHCESAETLPVGNFNTAKSNNFDNVFSDCWAVKSLDLSKWNTDRGRETRSMFNRCRALKELDLSHMSFASAELQTYMFYQMSSLEVLHLESMDCSRWTDMANKIHMFRQIPNLKDLYLGEKGYNTDSFKPSYFFSATDDKAGARTSSLSGSLTIHCTQKGADWLSKTNLRWINSGYSGMAPVPVKFVDYKTGAELTVTWPAN
ncbi:MAG: BspA family leucine-rich repeat surface protein [Bacteroidales bacterium]|nr:BspA family leucine-rich repeat surface protein [Bacteroidales bacterium]